MSTALVSAFYDFSDVLSKNNHFTAHKVHMKVTERKSVPSFGLTARRTSSPNTAVCLSNNKVTNAAVIASLAEASVLVNGMNIGHHRKLDRSLSEPVDRSGQQQQQRAAQVNSSRYKTELCRPFEESGKCKYGDKCQFAHGAHELRTLARHPKYKTELCRTFHTSGLCPYGPRCHFIHNAELSVDGMYRSKVGLCVSGFNDGDSSPTPSNSSLSESPTSVCGFFEDYTPATTPTANNAFTFNSQDFSVLVSSPSQSTSSSPPTPSKRVQQQNAYNTALNRYSVSMINQMNINNNINDMDMCVFRDSPNSTIVGVPTPTSTPPLLEPNPPSPIESITSELDNLSMCGSPPTTILDINGIRLPIFSRLSVSED